MTGEAITARDKRGRVMILSNSDIVELTNFRHRLHSEPELSGEERETARKVVAMLERIGGCAVLTGLGGHGVAAIFAGEAPGPTVLLRAELDALAIQETGDPAYKSTIAGKAHMCGHDGHSAALLGCAMALRRQPPARGRVVLMFQPAEEDGAGAASVIADPRFAGIAPDYGFSWHNMPGLPFGVASYREGPMFCASVGMRVRLEGRTAHAAQPEAGLSPAQALAGLMRDIAALGPVGPMDDDFRLVTITHARLGEPTFGVAPGHGELRATLRALLPDRMTTLCADAEALARRAAAQAGLEIAIDWRDDFASTINDPEATAIMARALSALNIPTQALDHPIRASEDFGRFGAAAKTVMILLGAGEDVSMIHNPDYDFPDALIPIGAGVLLGCARELLG